MVVEDDATFQHMLCETIRSAPDLQVQSIAGTLTEALHILNGAPADVLLVDLGLPDGSGIEVIRVASERWPACGIMVSTAFGDEMHVMQSLEAGATGYLLKDSAADKIVAEIRSLHQGGSPISPLIARQILMRFRERDRPPSPPQTSEAANRPSLSAREQEVLEYITKGFTIEEIAGLLGVSRHTVQTFVRRIYKKLEVRSKAEAIYEARVRGMVGS